MLDFAPITPNSSQIKDFRVFMAAQSAGTTTDSWQTWTKPRGASFVYGLVIGSGGGGGSPNTGNVTAGGGGASGAVSTFLIPAYYLPDTLYVRPGIGGSGATTVNSNGANGDTSYIATAIGQSGIASFNEAVLVTAAGGGGGQGGGTQGTAGVIAVFSNQLSLGITSSIVGVAGANGGTTGTQGAARSWGSSGAPPVSGGAGGGGYNGVSAFAGGNVTVTGGAGVAPFATLTGASATNGQDGHGFNKPIPDLRMPHQVLPYLAFTGGVGGGCPASGTGNNGGRGGLGCGGGGGGGGSTQGNGGYGGDALILLMAF